MYEFRVTIASNKSASHTILFTNTPAVGRGVLCGVFLVLFFCLDVSISLLLV